jgi:NitT/TauT family transport system substrate-binding protein
VNVPTNQTALALASGSVDAIGAWQPTAGQALKASAGSKAVFTSANVPGLIYDLVCVNPQSLAARRDDWVKFVKVWNRIVKYVLDPTNKDEVVKMMAGRAGVPPAEYAAFLPGTHFLTPAEALQRFDHKDGLGTLLGSGKVADAFHIAHKVYKVPQPVDTYIDGSLSKDALAK